MSLLKPTSPIDKPPSQSEPGVPARPQPVEAVFSLPSDLPVHSNRAWQILLAVGLIASAGYFLIPRNALSVLNGYFAAVNVLPVVAIIIGVRRYRPAKFKAWFLFAGALTMWVLGEVAWAVYNFILDIEAPFPSVADMLFLIYYPLLGTGLFLLTRDPSRKKNTVAGLDTLIVTSSLGILIWNFLIMPYLQDPTLTPIQIVTSITFPLMDILVLTVALKFWLAPMQRSFTYYILAFTLGLTLLTDMLWCVSLVTKTYYTGHPLTLGWLVAYALWSAAALHPSMRWLGLSKVEQQSDLRGSRLVLIMVIAACAPASYVIQMAQQAPINLPLFLFSSVVLLVLVYVRASTWLHKLGKLETGIIGGGILAIILVIALTYQVSTISVKYLNRDSPPRFILPCAGWACPKLSSSPI